MLAEVCYQVMRIFNVRHQSSKSPYSVVCALVRVCLARRLASLHLRLHVCRISGGGLLFWRDDL